MNDRQYLDRAINLAMDSKEPMGCGAVIVSKGRVIAEGSNSQRLDKITINHAEIKAIVAANKKLGSRQLKDCTVYCSCQPCIMCLTALSYAKVERVVFSKTLKELSPEDPQSDIDPYEFIKKLKHTPKLECLK